MKKSHVLVLQGGTSAEHEVSLASGKMVAEGLSPDKYAVTLVTITKEGTWLLPDTSERYDATVHHNRAPFAIVYQSGEAMDEIRGRGFDAVFIALHGTHGEDGSIQGVLELAAIPYTGSGVLASALAMDKVKSAEILQFHGLAVPKYISFNHPEWSSQPAVITSQIATMFGFPVVIKPCDSGSSVGISLVQNLEGLADAIERSLIERPRVIAQEFIKGVEVTCPVLDDGRDEVTPLPPIEIVPTSEVFYNYEAKYASGGSDHIIPPRLADATIASIQKIAARAHQALGCSGMSRTDMIVRDNEIFVLEVNTIPGLTNTSLLPHAAAAAGMDFSALLDHLIQSAINRFHPTNAVYAIQSNHTKQV